MSALKFVIAKQRVVSLLSPIRARKSAHPPPFLQFTLRPPSLPLVRLEKSYSCLSSATLHFKSSEKKKRKQRLESRPAPGASKKGEGTTSGTSDRTTRLRSSELTSPLEECENSLVSSCSEAVIRDERICSKGLDAS